MLAISATMDPKTDIHKLTSCVITKLSANYMSVTSISTIIRHSSPLSIEVHLHSPLPAVPSSHQTNITTLVVSTFQGKDININRLQLDILTGDLIYTTQTQHKYTSYERPTNLLHTSLLHHCNDLRKISVYCTE